MVPFVVALDKARGMRGDIDYFHEREDAWVFSRKGGGASDEAGRVVVLKESGEAMLLADCGSEGQVDGQVREGYIADFAASKDGSPRIPIVAAQAFIHGITYEESLAMYEGMTEEQRVSADEAYNRDNMGYGLDAWETYKAACREREGAGLPLIP